MKLKHSSPLPKSRKALKKPGFALIATLTLMMLLAMLAVGLMAMVSSQNRIALQTILQAEARQQALVGLDVAIGELQVEMGPDRRVSANSGVVGESAATPQNILGVWDSWGGPIYGSDKAGKKGGKIQTTYSTGRKNMFRRWMISTRNEKESRNFDSINGLAKRRPGQRICMVGEGTLGSQLTQQHYIYADMISMPAAGEKNKTAFAWWIGGENQKAKISVENPKEPENTMEMLHRTWDTPAPMIVDNNDLNYLPDTIENSAKISTMASIALLGSSSQNAGMPYFHDVTTTSYTLPINVRTGGFKQDLNLLLNKKSLRGTEFAPRQNQDCPIVEGNDVPKGSESNMPIGSWQNLFAYYNCWPNGSASDEFNFTARLLGSTESPYTRMSGTNIMHNGEYVNDGFGKVEGTSMSTSYDTRACMDVGDKYAGYARTPIMLAFMCNYSLQVTPGKNQDPGKDLLRLNYTPLVLWWNPYNVPMKIRGQQLWTHSHPYRAGKFYYEQYDENSGIKNDKLSRLAVGSETREYYYAGYSRDSGEYFQSTVEDKTGDIVFQPGEIIFFSPGRQRTTGHGVGGQGYRVDPLTIGYNPIGVNSCSAVLFRVNPAFTSNMSLNLSFYADGSDVGLQIPAGCGAYVQDNENYGSHAIAKEVSGHGGFSVLHGLAGTNGQGFSQDLGRKDYFGISPKSYMLNWYDTSKRERSSLMFCTGDNNDAYWDSSQNDPYSPYFVGAVGVVAKSANPNVDTCIFPGSDFRGKIWQHSNPAFWGSVMVNPCDQERQYSPMQLAVLPVSGGMNSSPMDNIGANGRNGYLGINSEGEQVSFASVMELPVHPPFSLAGLAGMRLTPGWYQTGSGDSESAESGNDDMYAAAIRRRTSYQAGVPGVGIGNAFADPCLPAGDVYTFHQSEISTVRSNALRTPSSLTGNEQIFGDFFDHGLLINDALWDRWFCSSVSDMPNGRGTGTIDAKETLTKFIYGEAPLPVSRYKKTTTPYSDEQIIKRIMDDDGWKHIAQYLMIDGGFNVNSTSVEAWAAVLQGLANRKLVAKTNSTYNNLQEVEANKSNNQVLFSRFMLSTTDKSVDSIGGYSPMIGSRAFRQLEAGSAWSEVRMLEPESIRRLAEEMVKQVRKRGPFLNMSDFINRRLEPNGGELALTGALQAAIDATDINREFKEVMITPCTGSLYRFPEAEKGSMHTAAPGYLIQSDVLASLGNILTVRDDTFTVRAYGCVRNAQDAVLAQAWCEAVVQRTMDYVDPSNSPGDSEYDPDGTRGSGLSNANKVMGRQFRIVSFKWLDHWDI